MIDAIRAVFPHGKGQPSKSRDSKDVFEVDEDECMSSETKGVENHDEVFEVWQGIAEQIQEQGSDYDSEEVLEVFESYKDIKCPVQDRKIRRGLAVGISLCLRSGISLATSRPRLRPSMPRPDAFFAKSWAIGKRSVQRKGAERMSLVVGKRR